LANKKGGLPITSEDEKFISAVSRVFGTAIKNADLFHSIWNVSYGL